MGSRLTVAVDWDDTLVDAEGDWLPGALDGLRWLRREGHTVVIHSARANYEKGFREIEAKLAQYRLPFKIEPKPAADLYIDDRAARFDGRWPAMIALIREARRAA